MQQQEEATSEAKEYLTITLDNEQFALDINRVSEVLDLTQITRVPRMPDFVLGVINLRSNVVPVIDLRQKLGMESGERTKESCIVIVELEIEGEATKMGALTDSIDDVMGINPEQIAPPPRMGTNLRPEFIEGMVRLHEGEKFLIILDIEMILSSEELAVVKKAGEEQEGSEGYYQSGSREGEVTAEVQ
ncbi:MAG: chemotaxis protein CheW [Thermodesulfobacteriota bacterium]